MLRTGQKRKASDLDLSLSTRPPKSPRKLSTSLGSRTAVSFLPTPLQGLFNRFFAPQMTIVDESGPALPPKQVSPWAAAPTTSARSIYPTPSPTNSSSDAGPSRPPPPPPPASRQHIWGTSAFDAQRRAIPSMNDAEAWPTLGGTAKLSQPKSTTSLRTVPSTSAAWQKKEPMFQRKEARRIADQDEEDRMRLQLQWLDATQAGKTTSSFEDYRGAFCRLPVFKAA